MKYIFIVLVLLLVGVQMVDVEYSQILSISLYLLALLAMLFMNVSNLNRHFQFDYRCRSENKGINIYELGFSFLITIGLIISSDFKSGDFLLFLIIWFGPIQNFIMMIFYKYRKPFTIYIKEDEFIFKNLFIQKRNITELTQINFDRINKTIKLNFESNSRIVIPIKEYSKEDMKEILDILIEKSKQKISVQENYTINQ